MQIRFISYYVETWLPKMKKEKKIRKKKEEEVAESFSVAIYTSNQSSTWGSFLRFL